MENSHLPLLFHYQSNESVFVLQIFCTLVLSTFTLRKNVSAAVTRLFVTVCISDQRVASNTKSSAKSRFASFVPFHVIQGIFSE